MKTSWGRLLALLLALGMLLSMLPTVAQEDENGLEVDFEAIVGDEEPTEDDAPEELGKVDLADDDATDTTDGEAAQDASEAGNVAAPEGDGLYYARLETDATLVEAGEAGETAWPLAEGFVVLVLEDGEDACRVAIGTTDGAVEGCLPARALQAMTDEETAAFMDTLAQTAQVVLYRNDLNRPLMLASAAQAEAETETDATEPDREEEPEEAEPEASEELDEAALFDAVELDEAALSDVVDSDEVDLDDAVEPDGQAEDSGLLASEARVYDADFNVSMTVESDVDNDALFAGYANRLFYGNRGRNYAGTDAGRSLTGHNRKIYDLVKAQIIEVAAGNRASAVFTVPFNAVVNKFQYTAEEMSVTLERDADGRVIRSEENDTAMLNGIEHFFQRSAIMNCLKIDCPYELYWWNASTYGWGSQGFYYIYDESLNTYVLWIAEDGYWTFSFDVAEEYRKNGDYQTVDSSKIDVAKRAAANARAIVDKYKTYSDYAKLYAYAAEIAYLTDYNDDAIGDEWDSANANPWQLIWVFDGNPDTKVVCEGYAKAFRYLAELSSFDNGIHVYYVAGDTAKDGNINGKHAWNLVRMEDGQNYLVDVTWLDDVLFDTKPTDTLLLQWINEEKGDLFLCGAPTGNLDDGYDIGYRGYDATTWRRYYDDFLSTYGASVLTLAKSRYVLNGFERIGGKTYYFENGKYVTGIKTLNNMSFKFGDDGVLQSGWSIGWHTINGRRLYFDSDGLHTVHTVVNDAAVAPTCTQAGKTAGTHCSVCGTVLIEQETVPAKGHTPTTVKGRAATCTAAGLTDGVKCSVCNVWITKQQTIAAKGHTATTVKGRTATCAAAGLTDGVKCSVCNAWITPQQTIAAKGHTAITVKGRAATYTATGLTDGKKCSVCGTWITPQQTIARKVYTGSVLKKKGKNGTITAYIGTPFCLTPTFATNAKTTVKKYKSSKTKIATVNSSGLVTPKKAGTTTITVTTANKKVKATVTIKVVAPPPESIAITNKGPITLKKGKAVTLKTALTPKYADATLKWTSSDKSIATVDKKGKVKAKKKAGTVTITVTSTKNKKAKATITIKVVP